MIESIRDLIQPLTNLIAKPFTIFHPNVLSFMSFLVAAPGFYFYAKGDSLLGSLFILGAMFDGIDGTVARMTNTKSKFGGILDATLDRVFEGVVLLFIGVGELVPWPLLFIFYIASISISYIKAKAEATVGENKVGKNKFSVGITQRGDRMTALFLASVASYFLTPDNHEILTGAIAVLSLFCLITIIWRGIVIFREVEK